MHLGNSALVLMTVGLKNNFGFLVYFIGSVALVGCVQIWLDLEHQNLQMKVTLV